jgi:septal ring factor EnvC (AmiA/AmiB activator)
VSLPAPSPGGGSRGGGSRRWLVLLSAGVLVLSAGPASPQQPTRLEELEKKIERLRRELADAEAREAQLIHQQGDTQALLKQLGTQIVKSEQLLNALAQQIRNNTREVERLQGEIAQLEARIGRLRGGVAAYLVDLYKHGRRRSWELVLGSESFTEGMRRLKGVTVVAARQRRDVDRMLILREERSTAQAEAARRLAALERDRRIQESTRTSLQAKRRQAQQELDRIGRDARQVQQVQQQAQAELDRLIKELAEEQRRLAERGGITLSGFPQMRGRLPWPLRSPNGPGTIVRGFGRLRGRDNTVVTSPGIDIMTDRQASILAVHNSQVVRIEWLNYMGTVIILAHGDGYMTVYTNARDLQVDVGDYVPAGLIMGGVGMTLRPVGDEPSTAENLLRFSIYKDGEAQDPVPWLGVHR